MLVIGLDGKEYKLKLKEAEVDDVNRSSGHLKCRKLLKEIYPSDKVFEEIVLPGCNGIRVDFIIPLRKSIIEVQGIQHFQFSPFFHKSKADFFAGKNRDRDKIAWAELNGFRAIVLDAGRSIDLDQWKYTILNS